MPKDTGLDLQRTVYHPFNSTKVLCHAKRMEAIVNEWYLPPVVLNLDVSGRCQYRCGHCHHRRKQVHDRQLPDLEKRLANTLPFFLRHWEEKGERVLGCCIVGSQGDALLYPHLPQLLKNLHFAGVEVGLVTNGYGFTDKLIDYAVHYTKFIGFSMDAGTKETYHKIKNCPKDGWYAVEDNVYKVVQAIKKRGLRNDVGWKILVLPENQNEIYKSCEHAKKLGCRYVQIRPADLPDEEREKINIQIVNNLIAQAIDELEEPGVFEIVGVGHKFTPEFKQILPKYCHLTPLTATVTSDGKVYACVDRRCDKSLMIADCGEYGWSALRDAWGKKEHVQIVHNMINCGDDGPECEIRCSNYGYDKFFQNYFVHDNVDWRLI